MVSHTTRLVCYAIPLCPGPRRPFENGHFLVPSRRGAALVRCFGEVLRSRAPREAERRTGCAHTLQILP
eukprot:scaffold92948_cov115-Phaeocystis_antarctica.AAC.1